MVCLCLQVNENEDGLFLCLQLNENEDGLFMFVGD